MKLLETNEDLYKLLEKYWNDGGCVTCGWHGSIHEYSPDLGDWNNQENCFDFGCVNSDVDSTDDHKGFCIYPSDEDVKIIELSLTNPQKEQIETIK